MKTALRTRWQRWFAKKQRLAVKMLDHPDRVEGAADQALAKARRVGKLRQAWSDIQVLVRLVRAWSRGQYRDVSRGTILLALGALVYFVAPIDAIVDGIPGIGYIDDAAILAWVLSEVQAEIHAFRDWETRALAASETPPAVAQLPS